VDTTIQLGSVALNGVALTSDRSRLYVSSVGGTVTEINTAADTVVRSFRPGGLPQDLVVGRGDSTLYLANEAGWVQVWNLKRWTRTDSIPVPAAFGLALTQDGEQLWVTETAVGGIAVVDGASRAVIETIPVLGSPRHLAMTPDGTTAVVANEAGVVQIIRQGWRCLAAAREIIGEPSEPKAEVLGEEGPIASRSPIFFTHANSNVSHPLDQFREALCFPHLGRAVVDASRKVSCFR